MTCPKCNSDVTIALSWFDTYTKYWCMQCHFTWTVDTHDYDKYK